MREFLKFVLIGGAGYFAWKAFKPDTDEKPETRVNTETSSNAPPDAVKPTPAPVGPSASQIQQQNAANQTMLANYASASGGDPTDALIMAAMNVRHAANVPDVRMNWHEWNWYLAKAPARFGIPAQTIYGPEDVGMTGRELITAAEYHAAKSSKGLQGGYLLRRRFA